MRLSEGTASMPSAAGVKAAWEELGKEYLATAARVAPAGTADW